MFNKDFYPTPHDVIETMLSGVVLEGKTILEPSAGSGNIVEFLKDHGATVIACEIEPKLREILKSKCRVIADDFLTVAGDQISHVDLIVMNPPFSRDEKHILHAYEIAPPGCKVIALCNWATIDNDYNRYRRELRRLIDDYGHVSNLGNVFSAAERKTDAEIGLIVLVKPGGSYDREFEGFFLDEDPDETQAVGIMPYNFVRDLVNRYIAAVKIFDEQLDAALRLNDLTSSFYRGSIGLRIESNDAPLTRAQFKKALQKDAWGLVFNKMGMEKYSTKGLKEDLNKFVETQEQVPFTMRNVYRMIEIVIATHSQRMDRALLEVFDNVTKHHHENRFNVEGWKTNSHYLVNRKFIMEGITEITYRGTMGIRYGWRNAEIVDDFQKALCYITGYNYSNVKALYQFFSGARHDFGTWYEWGFFKVRGYKKGTMHFEFIDEDIWARFNQEIARLKGYPLFEAGKYTRKKAA